MRKIKCYECGKLYNFDVDDFCPKCGAFNQPLRTTRVAADGTVVRNDGLNESNHEGSFVHAELHEENKERKRTGLDQNVKRSKPIRRPISTSKQTRSTSFEKPKKSKGVIGIFGWILVLYIIRAILAIVS